MLYLRLFDCATCSVLSICIVFAHLHAFINVAARHVVACAPSPVISDNELFFARLKRLALFCPALLPKVRLLGSF